MTQHDPNITIVGDGQMGLVCAAVLASQQHTGRVTLWGHEPRAIETLEQTRTSPRLAGLKLPARVKVTSRDDAALADADYVVCAVPTQFVRSVFVRLRRQIPAKAALVSVAKGIEHGTMMGPAAIIADALGEPLPWGLGAPAKDQASSRRGYAVLSGPTIAPELARCLPATLIAASDDEALARQVQWMFGTGWLRVYTSADPVGVEIAGATKNVIAIAAGILDGLRVGYNAKSALLARGLAEIARLGVALGARPETFFGLAGVGDLATTCFSPEGRNRSCGEALGRGQSLAEYIKGTDSVVEGVATAASVTALARRIGVEMPITAAVHAVLYEGVDPIDAIQRLMSREVKAERVG